jgi:hypothetical protein
MSKKKGHEGHICSLMGCDGVEAVARLVADARFVCTRCGRAANKKKNLCKPSKIASYLKP